MDQDSSPSPPAPRALALLPFILVALAVLGGLELAGAKDVRITPTQVSPDTVRFAVEWS